MTERAKHFATLNNSTIKCELHFPLSILRMSTFFLGQSTKNRCTSLVLGQLVVGFALYTNYCFSSGGP